MDDFKESTNPRTIVAMLLERIKPNEAIGPNLGYAAANALIDLMTERTELLRKLDTFKAMSLHYKNAYEDKIHSILKGAVPEIIRCPDCGDVVQSFFEHVDQDCLNRNTSKELSCPKNISKNAV